jgi:hypothetical protein
MPGAPQIFDQRLLRARRDRIANNGAAAEADFLLARVADDFVERLGIVRREFPVAANVGAYHGFVARRLRNVPSIGRIIDVESSLGCLELSGAARVAAADDALPFAHQSLDLIVSALSLHLVNDLPGALLQINRAL